MTGISTPSTLSKKGELKLRSVNNVVIPPANTGTDNNTKNAVIQIDQTKSGKRS